MKTEVLLLSQVLGLCTNLSCICFQTTLLVTSFPRIEIHNHLPMVLKFCLQLLSAKLLSLYGVSSHKILYIQEKLFQIKFSLK